MPEQRTDDETRKTILKYFYDRWKNPRGMSSCKVPISKIYSDMKKQGIERGEVVRNLTYLVETGWIKEDIEEYEITRGKRKIKTKKVLYKISSDGIDFFDGSSKFQRVNKLAGINMSNVQDSVVILGNNNYVRNEFRGLYESLENLDRQIRLSNELTDEEKMSYQGEIGTIQNQLKKQNPDKSILKRAWESLKNNLPTVASLVSLIEKVKPIIEGLL